MGQAGFTEMHLVVNDARQQVTSVGIYHVSTGGCLKVTCNLINPAISEKDIGLGDLDRAFEWAEKARGTALHVDPGNERANRSLGLKDLREIWAHIPEDPLFEIYPDEDGRAAGARRWRDRWIGR